MELILKKKNTLFAAFMLVVMMFSFMPAPQPVAALYGCDAAQFVADVTVPDGTIFAPGATFNKTWRIRNVGSCTWSSSGYYTLVYVDGTQMGAPASTNITSSVAPGSTVDLTVALTAPNTAGEYRGNFQLKNASGTMFGIGVYANKSFWVDIIVSGSGGSVGYDFVANAPSATWTSGAGNLTFPGTQSDSGFAQTVASPHLENGTTDTHPGLLTVPQNVYNGYIQGVYPVYHVQTGDHFQSIVNCEYNATSCYVNFRLNYQIGNGPVQTFWSFRERYEGLYYNANLDLSSLAGQDVKFILYIGSAGYADGDRALWGAPRITQGGSSGGVVTPTPTPIAVVSGCDRATFITDVNVSDGTVFPPNTAFTKTWRIKNVGSCTWTTDYKLVFVSGDKMGGPDSVNLTSTVGPNTSFNISVNLTSPSTAGSYRGYWELKNSSGNVFGIGYNADKAWWVDINVNTSLTPGPTPTKTATPTVGPSPTITPTPTVSATPGAGFDFTLHPEQAEWKNGSGTVLTFGGTSGDSGYAYKLASVQLEDGVTYNSQPSLLMVPQNVTDGYIQGTYPSYTVQSGDHFMARIGCMSGYPNCNVKFWLYFKNGGGTVYTIADYAEKFDTPVGLTRQVDIPLTSLVGQTGNFILAIGANGSPTGDDAPWVYPHIQNP